MKVEFIPTNTAPLPKSVRENPASVSNINELIFVIVLVSKVVLVDIAEFNNPTDNAVAVLFNNGIPPGVTPSPKRKSPKFSLKKIVPIEATCSSAV